MRVEGQCRWMLGLVAADFTSAGKTDLCDRTPSGFLHIRHADTLLSECDDLRLQIVTHEKQFVPLNLFGRMNSNLCRRQREDEPSVASVHRGKSEDVPTEGAISRRILAVEDYMRTKNHERCLSHFQRWSYDPVSLHADRSLPVEREAGPRASVSQLTSGTIFSHIAEY